MSQTCENCKFGIRQSEESFFCNETKEFHWQDYNCPSYRVRIKKYRKKPVIIEAIQWTGQNSLDVIEFTNNKLFPTIETLEGIITASIGDFIIKGVNGEFYPCKSDIFNKTYEEAEDDLYN